MLLQQNNADSITVLLFVYFSVVFCKLVPVLEKDKNLPMQMSVHLLSPGSPYQYFHSFISAAMAPYFKTFVRVGTRASRENDQLVQPVEKKISELEMGLLHLQQNIGIPEINLVINPVVLQVTKGRVPIVFFF